MATDYEILSFTTAEPGWEAWEVRLIPWSYPDPTVPKVSRMPIVGWALIRDAEGQQAVEAAVLTADRSHPPHPTILRDLLRRDRDYGITPPGCESLEEIDEAKDDRRFRVRWAKDLLQRFEIDADYPPALVYDDKVAALLGAMSVDEDYGDDEGDPGRLPGPEEFFAAQGARRGIPEGLIPDYISRLDQE